MKKLSGYCRSFLYSLWRKREYFSKRGMLKEDGSFYYKDKHLAAELGCSDKTIKRCKEFSKNNGYITYKSGTWNGNATKYWILRKPDKKSPFVDISKPDNLSAKPDNLSLKAPQNVTPNKVITNINNKEVFNNVSKDEDLKNGVKALAKLKGVDYTKASYINMGYSESEVERALEGDLS